MQHKSQANTGCAQAAAKTAGIKIFIKSKSLRLTTQWGLRLRRKKGTPLQTQTSAGRTESLSEEASGRVNGGSVSQQIRAIIPGAHLTEGGWSAEDECERCIRKFQLFQFEFVFRLFLRPFALGDLLAKRARMLAVEGFHDRLAEGRFLRVADYHRCPGYGLQNRPVQAD